jgi:hypothetical protein
MTWYMSRNRSTLTPKRDIYIGRYHSSVSFPLKTVTEEHQTVTTTSIHNSVRAWKQKLCILIAALEAASCLCCWDSGLTTESSAVSVLRLLWTAIMYRTNTNTIRLAAQYYTNNVCASTVSVREDFTCGSVQFSSTFIISIKGINN